MAKFIKSIFSTDIKSESRLESEEGRNPFSPPIGGRRKLSISRSGRMKANKNIQVLENTLYGVDYSQEIEKPKSVEYCANNVPATKNPCNNSNAEELNGTKQKDKNLREAILQPKTPEEEIDLAFKVIDNT